jgi:hypothetical protein
MEAFHQAVNAMFQPMLQPLFRPVNNFIGMFYQPWATAFAVGLFICAMIWVFTLKKEYVNLDAPSKHIWHDLRFWTVASMLPHVIVYFYFS